MKRNKKRDYLSILLLLVVGLSIGYALLQTTLTINGTSKIKGNTWDIHFANLSVTEGSVTIGTGDVAAAIQSSTTDITYTVTLNEPGDFYEFTVDAVNAGTIDGMIESVTSKLNNAPITTLPAYLDYSVAYSDGIEIAPNQYLKAGDSETYKVRIEFNRDIENTDLPSTVQTLTLAFGVVYIQADDTAVERPVPTFEDSDWDTIINTIKSKNSCGPYNVGDSKEIDMGTFGTHTLRIANCTKPTECSTEGFSQTACGVVLEFVDVITTHRMNPWVSGNTDVGNGNIGGWPASEMRTYVNNDIYNALPSTIKNAIIDTTVVSGHTSNDTTNFTTTDKLYLLSTHEVFEDVDGNTSRGPDYYDTAYHNTRQLDYYKGLNVTTSNYSSAIKKNGTSNSYWWLRSADSYGASNFFFVYAYDGYCGSYIAGNTYGVSPAFRIA